MAKKTPRKKPMPRITEPDEGLIHYAGPPGADQVTLCGRTDWIGVTAGKETDEPINCQSCENFVMYFALYRP